MIRFKERMNLNEVEIPRNRQERLRLEQLCVDELNLNWEERLLFRKTIKNFGNIVKSKGGTYYKRGEELEEIYESAKNKLEVDPHDSSEAKERKKILMELLEEEEREKQPSKNARKKQRKKQNKLLKKQQQEPQPEPQECAICLEEITEFEKMPNCSCKIACHKECLADWFKINPTCPTCRR